MVFDSGRKETLQPPCLCGNNRNDVMKEQDIRNLIEHWVRPEIRAISAYHVPDASGLVKLDAMENPYTWPPELREEWLALLRTVDVNRYPDPEGSSLAERLKGNMGVPAPAELLLGNGSDELIQMLAMTVSGPSRVVLSVDPGFVMYRMIATFCGMKYVGVPLKTADFSLDMPALLQALDQYQPALTFLAYPNNPTGNLFAPDQLSQIIEAAPGIVVIDEAYAPFTDHSFMHQVGDYPNLTVLRTVSKMGLAGLRLGFLAGPEQLIREIDKTRLPYNINILTQVSAEFALRHQGVFDDQTNAIRTEREHLFQVLSRIEDVVSYPSEANFILLRMPEGRAGEIHAGLRENGILVKLLDGAHAALADCLRVTVGTSEENDRFLQALSALL